MLLLLALPLHHHRPIAFNMRTRDAGARCSGSLIKSGMTAKREARFCHLVHRHVEWSFGISCTVLPKGPYHLNCRSTGTRLYHPNRRHPGKAKRISGNQRQTLSPHGQNQLPRTHEKDQRLPTEPAHTLRGSNSLRHLHPRLSREQLLHESAFLGSEVLELHFTRGDRLFSYRKHFRNRPLLWEGRKR